MEGISKWHNTAKKTVLSAYLQFLPANAFWNIHWPALTYKEEDS